MFDDAYTTKSKFISRIEEPSDECIYVCKHMHTCILCTCVQAHGYVYVCIGMYSFVRVYMCTLCVRMCTDVNL